MHIEFCTKNYNEFKKKILEKKNKTIDGNRSTMKTEKSIDCTTIRLACIRLRTRGKEKEPQAL